MATSAEENNHGTQAFWLQALDRLEQHATACCMEEDHAHIQQLRERLSDQEFRLAVVGQFSSGKTTFVNAILGRDLLPHAKMETTATITRIVNVLPEDARAQTGRVVFQNGSEERLTDFSELKTYTMRQSKAYDVSKSIAFVELYVPFLSDGSPMVLVDTPGLNGTLGLEVQTYELVRKAHACLYLFKDEGLTEADIDYLHTLKQVQRSFIFVQGFIDRYHAWEQETAESQVEHLREDLQKKVFADGVEADWDVCGISALHEMAGRDVSIKYLYEDDEKVLTEEDRALLRKQSGFPEFYEILARDFGKDKLWKIKYRDTVAAILTLAKELQQRIRRQTERKKKIWAMSADAQDAQMLARRQAALEKRQTGQESELRGFVADKCAGMLEESRARLQEWSSAFLDEEKETVEHLDELQEIEQHANRLAERVNGKVYQWSDQLDAYIGQKFQNIHQLIMRDIERYTSKNLEDLGESVPVTTATIVLPQQAFHHDQSRIQKNEQAIREVEEQISREEHVLSSANGDVRSYQSQARDVERTLSSVRQRQQQELSRLGSKPAPRKRTRTISRTGWFAGLRDSILGKRTETYMDDSNVKAWELEKEAIQSRANDSLYRLRDQQSAINRKLSRAQGKVDSSQATISFLRKRQDELKAELKRVQDLQRREMDAARTKYLNAMRKKIFLDLHHYFAGDEGQIQRMLDYLHDAIEKEKEHQQALAVQLYRKSMKEELDDIGRNRASLQKDVDAMEAQARALDQLVQEMEGKTYESVPAGA